MQNPTRHILIIGLSLGLLSMVYFLSLVLYIPFFITVPLVAAGVFVFVRWAIKNPDTVSENVTNKVWPVIVLAVCLSLMVSKSYPFAGKYSTWDAWCIWNLNAEFLASGAHGWKAMLSYNHIGHPDYPLLLPGINGFFIRLFHGSAITIAPFVLSCCITLFIPVLLYLENLKRNFVVATLVLFLFAQDEFYLRNGVSQYADIILAFFFLSAIVLINYAKEDKKNIALAAAAIGCCMWTKNEGFILSAVLIAFNVRLFFSSKNIRYFIAGIALPLLVLAIFKIGFAPPNDVVSSQGEKTFSQLFMANRYELIYEYFSKQIDSNFVYLKISFFLYLLLCLVERKWPGKHFFMLICCAIAYMMAYILSPLNLDWHLETSIERLMLHLMPAMIYVFSKRFSRIQFSLSGEERP